VASVLVFLLEERLLGLAGAPRARIAGFLAALLFAVHPASSEAVSWAKALDDLMATALLLAAFLAAWKAWEPGRNGGAWAAAAAMCYAAALLSKESTVSFLPLFLFPLVLGPDRKRFFAWLGALAALVALFLLSRQAVLGRLAHPVPVSGTYGQTLVDMLPVTFLYARAFLGLPPFLSDYSFMKGGAPLFGVAAAGAALLGVVALVGASSGAGRARRPRSGSRGWRRLFPVSTSSR
jgi:hypothetical protein